MMLSAILLAAGESKRMRVNKLTLPWRGETVFEHCLNTLFRSTVDEIVVVLNPKNEETKRLFERKAVNTTKTLKVVFNPFYRRGMSTSIRKGLEATNPKSEGILIFLGDQPFLKTRTVNLLLRAFREGEGEIVVPSFRGMKGHPVIFHRKYRKELLKLKGDEGGKRLLVEYSKQMRAVPVRSEGVIKDIDTWQEYRRALRRGEKRNEKREPSNIT